MAKLIERSAKKTRKLDPMPTPLVVNCVHSLLLVITKIINLSLSTSSFSDEWKCAIVNYNTALAFPQYPCNGSSHTLSNRSQRIEVEGTSKNFNLECGVPQGSCLGPLLYIIYATKLFKIIEHNLPDAHCYADDTQLYLSFTPADGLSSQIVIQAIGRCIEDIRHWVVSDCLLLSDEKRNFC